MVINLVTLLINLPKLKLLNYFLIIKEIIDNIYTFIVSLKELASKLHKFKGSLGINMKSDVANVSIAILTLAITLFILMPNEPLNLCSLLASSLSETINFD